VLIAAAIPLLTACASNNPQEDKLGTFLVAPGKYVLYDCQQLSGVNAGYRARRDVLRKAMADAEKGPGGAVISVLAYRTEYGQVEGNLAEIRREAASKNCTLNNAAAPTAIPMPGRHRR
jgi:hypothetical protein